MLIAYPRIGGSLPAFPPFNYGAFRSWVMFYTGGDMGNFSIE
jgi:hypothetical protein